MKVPKLPASLLRSAARLTLPVAAAGVLFGGTAIIAVPAQASAAKPANFTWHTFTLLNGWKSATQTTLVTGTPAWALHDNVVYLKGAVKTANLGGETNQLATLPGYARPAHNVYAEIYTASDAPGAVEVSTSGAVYVFGGNAGVFASLGNVSFPVGIPSQVLALQNGWQSEDPMYSTGDPSYSVSDGVVYLSGSLAHGKTGWAAAVLPKAARPTHLMYVLAYNNDAAAGVVKVYPSGKIVPIGGAASTYTSLANISYPVASTQWHSYKLLAGWKSADPAFHTGSPAYAVINGVIYVGGALTGKKASSGLWTTFPASIQTPDQVFTEVSTTRSTTGSVDFAMNDGLAGSTPFENSQLFTSLAGLAHPLSS